MCVISLMMRKVSMLMCTAVLFTGCARESSDARGEILELAHDSVSDDLREACDFSDVVIGSAAHDREVERCQQRTREHRDAQLSVKHFLFVKALYQGDCDVVRRQLDPLGGEFSDLNADLVFMAGRLRKGLCVEMNAAKATNLLKQALEEDPFSPLALAHLGDMLWNGEGVPMDRARARQLFKRAVEATLPRYVEAYTKARAADVSYQLGAIFPRSQITGFWSYSDLHLAANFAHPILGPWVLPPPLYEERLKMDMLIHSDGRAIVHKVKQMLATAGASPVDQKAAYTLLLYAWLSHDAVASTQIARYILQSDGITNLPAFQEVFGATPGDTCAAFDYLDDGVRHGYAHALLMLIDLRTNALQRRLSTDIFTRLLNDATLSRYDVYDLIEPKQQSLSLRRDLLDFHAPIASLLAFGHPIPSRYSAVAARIISEAQDSSVPDIALPSRSSSIGCPS
ncbi:MAG: hypothetical protein AAF862_08150 [Pseudomonadota bacterium]